MTEEYLYNVLRSIERHKICLLEYADDDYYKALDKIGLISQGWDSYLTPLGNSVLEMLRNKFEKW